MKKFLTIVLFILGILITLTIACKPSAIDRQVRIEKKQNITNNINNIVTIVVISDLNSQYGAVDYEPEIDKAIKLITTQWQPDLVLGGGDAIAGQKKSLTSEQINAMWQAFDLHVAKPLRETGIPYAFTIGNHDGSGAIKNRQFVFAKERELASAYWNDPDRNSQIEFIDKANFPFYYTFAQHNIFYLVWDASTNKIDDRQLAWVEQSLEGKEARQASMRIAIGHLPLYAVAAKKNKPGEYLAEAEKLRFLLEQYRVHTYISGHHHAYYPGKKGNLKLLHSGALGQGARKLIDSNLSPRNSVTLVKIDTTTKITTYKTYDIKSLTQIENSELPRLIVGKNGLVLRDDISPTDLTIAEKQSCLHQLRSELCQP